MCFTVAIRGDPATVDPISVKFISFSCCFVILQVAKRLTMPFAIRGDPTTFDPISVKFISFSFSCVIS